MTIISSSVRPSAAAHSFAETLARPDERVVLLFPGLAADWRPALDQALVGRPELSSWIEELLGALDDWAATPAIRRCGAFPDGVSARFAEGEDPVVAPLGNLVTNLACLANLQAEGLPPADAALGHSAGLLAAWVASSAEPGVPTVRATLAGAKTAALIGALSAGHAWSVRGPATMMAVIDGPRTPRVRALIPDGSRIVIADVTSPTRHVVAGPAQELAELHRHIQVVAEQEAARHGAGTLGGAPLRATWLPLPLAAAFHHPELNGLVDELASLLDDALPRAPRHPVIDGSTGQPVPTGDPLRHLAASILARPMNWTAAVRAHAGPTATAIVVSPLSHLAGPTRNALAGTGALVLDPAERAEREALFTPGRTPARPEPFSAFAPHAVRAADGSLRIDNRHTRRANRSPVILAGMTPSTVEAPIVAAAANAGHVAELAGGGQVNEPILIERMAELGELLEAGHEVVFNTLFLDPYLWGLHIDPDGLVFKARAAGAPLCGLTVSAGIPEPDEAVALLDRLQAAGMWLNAFKPGTVAQVEAALRIAGRTGHTFWLHLEGGAAGGHHSWEGLDELLLATYARIREHDNVVLAVGGGIADPQRAAQLLSGRWARRYDEPDMPVDAVLLGTVAMATREAATSPSVKAALAAAEGHDGWVLRDRPRGGTTSGRSTLGADIHYLDNSAAAAARLLDGIAGDAAAIGARRDEIIEALARTAKPYFGDVEEMTYAQLLRRFVDLTALGRGGRYEDGAWLDSTHRSRFLALLQRTEARLHPTDSGPVPTLFAAADALDDPQAALERLLQAHPVAATALLHPADAAFFLDVAGRPGKPVPFVPVIDAEVRRWYLSDALWQAHDDRYDADAVLIIPGPAALAGITAVDEPVADLLDRFEAAVARELADEEPPLRAGRIAGAVQAALSAPTWRWLGQTRPNPLWRIAAPHEWETGIDLSGGIASEEARWSSGDEEARLVEHPDGAEISLSWPGLESGQDRVTIGLRVRTDHGVAIVEVVADALRGISLASTTAPADPGAHAAAVGAVGPLPDHAMSELWPAIFEALRSGGLDWAMFDLVHLRHEISPQSLPTRVAAAAPEVFRTATGLVVEIASNCGTAAARDRFFVRHANPDAALPPLPDREPEPGAPTPHRTVGSLAVTAPRRLESFALITGDHNPIHRSDLVGRFAGLPGRIVHGMWTSAAATRAVVELAADGDPGRLRSWSIDFVGRVLPGQRVEFTIRRTGLLDGARVLAVEASTQDGLVALGRAVVAPPRTIYVFPGQGIQTQGMGMDGYDRSPAARAVWDEADRITRDQLGFSILEVVRDNPTAITAVGERYRHPAGVLHLTQFTQVAMSTLAQAQVAELKEAGAFDPTAAMAGHSVGEYNALAALTGVLPLQACINLVFARGQGMHGLVPRDEQGNSDYRLGVIRPHLAGLTHEQAEALVAAVARETGELCQIVNHNLRGKQYAVAGTTGALAELARRLGTGAPGRDPLLFVPGIDVPFHSSALHGGVDDFRAQLQEQLPTRIDADDLIGRYVPNLYPVLFGVDREYVAGVRDTCGSQVLTEVLADWERASADRDGLARTLLVELLAWQFASPVRWIEAFELICAPRNDGGLAIERFVEVGVGTAPTLTNLAKGALALPSHTGARPDVRNVEVDAEAVFENDTDPVAQAAAPAAQEDVAEPVAAAPAQPAAAPRQQVPDLPLDTGTALRALLALRASVRPDQLGEESIEELVDGVSSRRNQILLDLGKEFGVAAIDGAHEAPLPQLAGGLAAKAKHYRYPGPVLSAAVDSALTGALGRLGAGPAAVAKRAASHWGLGDVWAARAALALTLGTREGASRRGGDLAQTRGATADELIDSALQLAAQEAGLTLAPVAAQSASGTVDAAAVADLREHVEGLLTDQAADLLLRLNGPEQAPAEPDPALARRLAVLEAEHGPAAQVAGTFDPRRHVHLASGALWALADIDHLVHGALAGRDVADLVPRIVAHRDSEPRIQQALRYHLEQASDPELIALLRECLKQEPTGIPIPGIEGLRVDPQVREAAASLSAAPGRFADQVALVTGASPNSIAEAAVTHLLRGGATVVLTTTSDHRGRIAHYRDLERRCAGPGAQLHIVRANLASFADIDALLEWLLAPTIDTSRLTPRETRPALWPTLVLPFAAAPAVGMVPDAGADSALTLRLMAVGVQRLIGSLSERAAAQDRAPFTVVLPQSNNLGMFGGDGGYAEAKASLLTMRHRWHSEAARWGRQTRLIGAEIGWVRGTGLMAANDGLAALAQERLGITTFSNEQMGGLIAALATPGFAARADDSPLEVDLSGGLGHLASPHLVREALAAPDPDCPRPRRENHPATIAALPNLPAALLAEPDAIAVPAARVAADDMIVIAGVAEYGPWGASATRLEAETGGLTASGVVDLAWRTGLISADGGVWRDTASGEVVAEQDVAERYRDEVLRRSGIRTLTQTADVAADGYTEYTEVFLDRPLTKTVSTREQARALAGPSGSIGETSDGWRVTLPAGAAIRIPQRRPLPRTVGGQFPEGSDPVRHGLDTGAAEQVDPLAAWNLVTTAEALADAGVTPEELLEHVHPGLIGNTQGSGMGGMHSLMDMVLGPVTGTGTKHANDILQEVLGNVVAAHTNQELIGGYGPMVHPVAACASAAVSLEEAVDKISLGKAEVVIAGGWDDLATQDIIGFADMSATADNEAMAAAGLEPDEQSRPGDRRRGGFVDSQGGGTFIVCRGSVARRLGLPVRAVVAYAGSFGDGYHSSIPAPGLGTLGAGRGGPDSPLARGLAGLGLTVDDIGVVSKHDTSTHANDPNEAYVHVALSNVLGRTPGAGLRVVSQKALTGHSKGGAAAWQLAGVCDLFATGIVPGNPNLVSPEPEVAPDPLVVDYRPLHRAEPVRAAVVTSLGFGHVSALVALAHPDVFTGAIDPADRPAYLARARARRVDGARRRLAATYGGEPLFRRRARDADSRGAETAMLLDAAARGPRQVRS